MYLIANIILTALVSVAFSYVIFAFSVGMYQNIFVFRGDSISPYRMYCRKCNQQYDLWEQLSFRTWEPCGKKRVTTTALFVDKARVIHEDKYDYSKVNYQKAHQNITIVCPKHGDFQQTPTTHLCGSGCPECAVICKKEKQRLSKEVIIDRFEKIHGNKYNYQKVKYQGAHKDVVIICSKHGEFLQTPTNHRAGQGCPYCTRPVHNTETFIQTANKIHNNKYNYSKTVYTNNATKLTVLCQEHGEFYLTANSHLNGHGCADCSGNKKMTTSLFVKRAKAVHGHQYDYSKVLYVNNTTSVIILCSKHGEFKQKADSHLRGHGCERCSVSPPFSKIEVEFIDRLINKTNNIKVEEVFWIKTKKKRVGRYEPDFLYRNCIIEINGDYWHMHPQYQFKENRHPITKKTMEEQHERDKKKMAYIRRQGYNTLVIWESEIKKDMDKAIEKAQRFLEKKLNNRF